MKKFMKRAGFALLGGAIAVIVAYLMLGAVFGPFAPLFGWFMFP